MSRAFPRYGLEHLAALALLAAIAVAVCWALRRARARGAAGAGGPQGSAGAAGAGGPQGSAGAAGAGGLQLGVRLGLAALLAGGLLYALIDSLPLRGLEWLDILPLHFCDLAVLLAVIALVTLRQGVTEVLYFWGLSGTLIAMLTPDVDRGFPDTRCVSFFALHGGVAITAALLVFGLGIRPRPRAHLRVFAITNLYALVVAAIDFAANENFLYLREKPSQPSLLDVMGPWPWYILAADALAFLIFWALMLPFRQAHARPSTTPEDP